jgi:hypothetical protein
LALLDPFYLPGASKLAAWLLAKRQTGDETIRQLLHGFFAPLVRGQEPVPNVVLYRPFGKTKNRDDPGVVHCSATTQPKNPQPCGMQISLQKFLAECVLRMYYSPRGFN